MNVIVIENQGIKSWLVFDTPAARDAEFDKLKKKYAHFGCGGCCECFRDFGNWFFSCVGRIEKVQTLTLANN